MGIKNIASELRKAIDALQPGESILITEADVKKAQMAAANHNKFHTAKVQCHTDVKGQVWVRRNPDLAHLASLVYKSIT